MDTNTPGQVKLIANPPLPDAPANPSASGTNLLIRLNWFRSPAASGYILKRSTNDGGPYATLAALVATNHSDAAVNPGTTFFYVVAATNTAGESANSVQVSAVPLPSRASTNLSFQVSGNRLQLSWPPDHLGWRLQIQTNPPPGGPGTNWVDWPGSITLTRAAVGICPTNASVFLRLVYP